MKTKLFTFLNTTYSDIGLLIIRVIIALLMMQHGYGKVTDLLSGVIDFADPIGIGEGPSLFFTAFSEFACSLLVLLGLFTRLALIPLIFTFVVIVFIVHGVDPIGDKELQIIYLISFIGLFLMGPGKYSLDNYFLKVK